MKNLLITLVLVFVLISCDHNTMNNQEGLFTQKTKV